MEELGTSITANEAPYFTPQPVEAEKVIEVNDVPETKLTINKVQDLVRDVIKDRVEIKKRQEEIKRRLLANPEYLHADEEVKSKQKLRKYEMLSVISEDETLARLIDEVKQIRLDKKLKENVLAKQVETYKVESGQLPLFNLDGQEVEFEQTIKIKTFK